MVHNPFKKPSKISLPPKKKSEKYSPKSKILMHFGLLFCENTDGNKIVWNMCTVMKIPCGVFFYSPWILVTEYTKPTIYLDNLLKINKAVQGEKCYKKLS